MLTELERRIIDISYKHKLAHLGSCLTSVGLIESIYESKKKDEPFILSNGHAGLALYVVLEKHGFGDAEELFKKYGTHPSRDEEHGIWCSTGSLGQGITIAVGMALSQKERDVYVLSSDGEMGEGSCWEALRIASENKLENLKIAVNANGSSGYGKIDTEWLDSRLQLFYPCLVIRTNLYKFPDWLQGVESHYVVMNEEKYKEISLC